MQKGLSLAGLALSVMLLAPPAAADDKDKCAGYLGGAKSDDDIITSCARLINSGKFKGYWLGWFYSQRADGYARKGMMDQAIADLTRSIQIQTAATSDADAQKSLPERYRYRGQLRGHNGDLDRAIQDFEQVLRLNKRDAWAYFGRGEVRAKKQDYDGAIADFSEHIRLIKEEGGPPGYYINTYFKRAVTLDRKGDRDGTIAAYQAFLELVDRDPHRFHIHLKDGEEAKARERLIALRSPEKVAPPKSDQPAATPKPPPQASPLPPALSTPPAEFSRRVALVIGNSAYRTVAGLPNPLRDAEAISSALRTLGFQAVRVENDLTREKLVSALRAFAEEAEKSDWAVIYYSGHGIEVGGVNYLVPIDAKLRTDRDVQDEAVTLDRVLSAVEAARKLRVIILDACRDNPFASQMRRTVASRSIGRGLSRMEPDVGTLVVYAAKHGEIALDGDGRNSPFAAALINRINTPGLEIRRLFDVVRDDVLATTNRRQMPFTYGSVPGGEEFFFLPK